MVPIIQADGALSLSSTGVGLIVGGEGGNRSVERGMVTVGVVTAGVVTAGVVTVGVVTVGVVGDDWASVCRRFELIFMRRHFHEYQN